MAMSRMPDFQRVFDMRNVFSVPRDGALSHRTAHPRLAPFHTADDKDMWLLSGLNAGDFARDAR